MRCLLPSCCVILTIASSCKALRGDKVLMSQIKTLTLRDGQMTRGRRVEPIPQLQCVGGDAQGLYTIDVMRCTNLGSDYGDEESISWKCTADVPKYFKLGSTDVVCEGYSGPDDPYVLKGSCGVEYRIGLTDEGYEKFGTKYRQRKASSHGETDESEWGGYLFWIIFFSILGWIIYSASTERQNGARIPGQGGFGGPWFGGDNDDPPPPYSPPPYYKRTSLGDQAVQQGWRPGFWSGLAAGAAGTAGINALRGSGRSREEERERGRFTSSSSRSGMGGWSSGESSAMGAARHESTGFGQSRRR